jgi:hypothetical protein
MCNLHIGYDSSSMTSCNAAAAAIIALPVVFPGKQPCNSLLEAPVHLLLPLLQMNSIPKQR